MSIEKFMQDNNNIRLSNINRWMVFNINVWCVYEHKYGAKKIKTLIETPDLDKALAVLKAE